MVRFSRSIERQKQIYSCEANSLGVVGVAIMKGQIVYVFIDANCLHGKAAELRMFG